MSEDSAAAPSGSEAFRVAAEAFAALVAGIGSGQWDRPALGVWNVRALVGHTSRALITMTTYLDRPAATIDVANPARYYVLAARQNTDPTAIVERGRQAGEDLGPRPAETVGELVDRAARKVDGADLDATITTIVGGMRAASYLTTRTFELVVHSLDIAAATDLAAPLPDPLVDRMAEVAMDVALELGHGTALLSALTGRHGLPEDFSVVP